MKIKTAYSRNKAKQLQLATPITDANLAKAGFYINGDDFEFMGLTITKFSDGFYHGVTKLSNMYDVSNLVYGK